MTLTTPRLARFAAVLLAIAMICALGWQGYTIWRQQQQGDIAQNTPAPVNRQTRPTEAVNLASLNLFGRVTSTPAANQPTENLPETNLRIFLRGVLAADGEYPASALIEGSDGKTEVYVAGDEIPGNASLRSVFPNRVVLERGGKLENLYFPETDDGSGMSVQTSRGSDGAESQANSPAETSATQPVVPAPANADQRREQIRQRLEQLRERLKANSN